MHNGSIKYKIKKVAFESICFISKEREPNRLFMEQWKGMQKGESRAKKVEGNNRSTKKRECEREGKKRIKPSQAQQSKAKQSSCKNNNQSKQRKRDRKKEK
jgi:hypothetical protein